MPKLAATADVHAGYVHERARLRIGRKIKKELPPAGTREHVGDSPARERSGFLLHQDFEGAPGVGRLFGGHEADLAVLLHVPALCAVAPACRRRALRGIELFPIGAELRDMRAAGVERHVEIGERIALGTERVRHLFQLDPVVTEERVLLQPPAQLVPDVAEVLRGHVLGEVTRDERCVIVAEFLTEPAQPPRQAVRRDAERQDEGGGAAGEAADDDRRLDLGAQPDMPVPRGEPVEGLEHGAIGDRFETPPLRLDRGQITVNAETEIARRVVPGRAACRVSRERHVRRRSRVPKHRQCRRPCHNMH